MSVTFETVHSPVLNYSLYQCHVPLMKDVLIRNDSEQDILDTLLRVTSEPDLIYPFTKPLPVLPAGQTVGTGLLDLQINPSLLAGLTERMPCMLVVEVRKGDEVLFTRRIPLDVLAYDQWCGLVFMPEMIAAFVTPNSDGIAQLMKQASRHLEQWTGDPSLDGYQRNDPNRVKQQVAALYAALQALNITYCEPPASFEPTGQRVRMAQTVLEQRMGTCIETSVLMASCLEAMGLHPLIVFPQGHAFVGVWLEDECFPEAVQDDVSALTKRIAPGVSTICVVETTTATAGKVAGFPAAEARAAQHLADESKFVLAVDIKRARAASIRPLPQRMHGATGWQIVPEDRAVDAVRPDEIIAPVTVVEGRVTGTKQQQWERRLLDLSLRNTLVSLRLTKSVLPLLTANLSDLEDALFSGDEFQVLERPQDWQNTERDGRMFEHSGSMDPFMDLLKFEFEHKRLRSPLAAAELSEAMTSLYRSARVSLEENGANTLYLTLGLLKWFETPASQKPRYAPLVLIPIDIVRKSAAKGFVLRLRDDEPQMNITLLEMLKQDFGLTIGGLDPLPTDEHGVDIRTVFSVLRQAVLSKAGWDVLEEAFIGIFSFSQFVLWNDIRSRMGDLEKNKVVSSLISGRLSWQPAPAGSSSADLDALCVPGRVFLPITADASQLEAISASGDGKSFVLHGPPGTGKSQTITNIIANALANGKTVLFVAEKMAALSVVQRRLEAIGVGTFCLELHSNKSKKKDVLEQLRVASESTRLRPPEDFLLQADKLAAQRDSLNSYVQALHKRHPFGLSLYEALAAYCNADCEQEIASNTQEFAALTREQLSHRLSICESLVAAARNTGHPSNHPLADVRLTQYSQSARIAAADAVDVLLRAAQDTALALAGLWASLGAGNVPGTATGLRALAAACVCAQKLTGSPSGLAGAPDLGATLQQVRDLAAHGTAMTAARSALLTSYRESILAQNGPLLMEEWQRADLQWFLPKVLGQNRIRKLLQGHSAGAKLDKAHIAGYLQALVAFQAEQKAIELRLPALRPLLANWWQEHNTNWDTLRAVCDILEEFDAALAQAVQHPAQVRSAIAAGKGTQELGAYATAWQVLQGHLDEVMGLLSAESKALDASQDYLSSLRNRATGWRLHLDQLREWVTWNKARAEAFGCGLKPVVDAYEAGMVHENIVPAYLKGRSRAAAEWILSQSPVLEDFSGAVFEDRVRQFQSTDALFEKLTRQEIYARLAGRIPNFTVEASQNSEVGILQRAIRSSGRGLSIRKLFEAIPNLLPRLCPCLLMSPLSVAQYLDPKYPPFDLIVFDEASQLPTSKAVGAIARGQEAIIVGDPKQLPPTSFFATNTADEEDFITEDLESILDDCLAISMPQSSLLWHYRSRHESLIAFSNSNYYENRLLTFPSPKDLISSVRFVPVNGFYDRGRTKQNRAEAEAVVSEILRRLSDETLRRKSIGVVTFSAVQQNLIDDLLTAAFVKRPELEEYALNGLEPLFIKNLENVQGDERDVILFSVGYGPDETGKVTLNFGPLNREGGWRRLNVAVSRAREEMMVFSALRPDQLNASRTSSLGVAGLKAFLEYAQSGKRVMEAAQAERHHVAQGIEKSIAAALKAEGYIVHTDIGCSGFRVNAAVVHPDRPSEYILGILCDGDIYQQARCAKDRELSQQAVLRQLGWQVQRIWALDWWDNPTKETRKLVSHIDELRRDKASGSQPESGGAPKPETIVPEGARIASAMTSPTLAAEVTVHAHRKPYVQVVLRYETISPDDFILPQNAERIAKKIAMTVNAEGPISHDLLCLRVLRSFGISRMGTRIERSIMGLLSRFSFEKTTQNGTVFYWPANIAPAAWEYWRVAESQDARRNAENLPAEEIACAVRDVLHQQIGLPEADLIRETARTLGYMQLGSSVVPAMQLGVQCALEKGWAVRNGANITER